MGALHLTQELSVAARREEFRQTNQSLLASPRAQWILMIKGKRVRCSWDNWLANHHQFE